MIVYLRNFEQAKIHGPAAARQKAFDWLYKNGFKVRSSGPRYIGKGRFDCDQFSITAEKRINKKVKRVLI